MAGELGSKTPDPFVLQLSDFLLRMLHPEAKPSQKLEAVEPWRYSVRRVASWGTVQGTEVRDYLGASKQNNQGTQWVSVWVAG